MLTDREEPIFRIKDNSIVRIFHFTSLTRGIVGMPDFCVRTSFIAAI
jgi:hypothetical protein